MREYAAHVMRAGRIDNVTLTLMELGTEAIGGAFDGYLRRWDYERGENQNEVNQYSTWYEDIAAVGGLWM